MWERSLFALYSTKHIAEEVLVVVHKFPSARSFKRAHVVFIITDLDPPSIKHGARDIRIVGNETNEVEIYVGTKLTVISETLVRVRCETSTDPAPAISWEIQGRNSDFKDIVLLSKDNSTLTLSEPRKEDSGVYTCTARNNVGRDSKSSNIEILGKVLKGALSGKLVCVLVKTAQIFDKVPVLLHQSALRALRRNFKILIQASREEQTINSF